MKIVSMHQPNYLPWIGFFSRVAHSDCFVAVGDVQYVKNSVINRNKITTESGWQYLTIPVGRKVNGLKIYNKPESVAWGIGTLFSDFDHARWMGRNGRIAVETVFSWDVIADEVLTVYNN